MCTNTYNFLALHLFLLISGFFRKAGRELHLNVLLPYELRRLGGPLFPACLHPAGDRLRNSLFLSRNSLFINLLILVAGILKLVGILRNLQALPRHAVGTILGRHRRLELPLGQGLI